MAQSLVTTSEAAALVGRSVRTVQRWACTGKLAPVVLGGRGPGSQNEYSRAEVLELARRDG